MAYTGGPMTEAMYYVLLALKNPNYGYQLMQSIKEVSRGRIEMGPGTLYGILSRLQEDNLIKLNADDGRRKTYSLTIRGEIALEEEYKRLKEMVLDGLIIEKR